MSTRHEPLPPLSALITVGQHRLGMFARAVEAKAILPIDLEVSLRRLLTELHRLPVDELDGPQPLRHAVKHVLQRLGGQG